MGHGGAAAECTHSQTGRAFLLPASIIWLSIKLQGYGLLARVALISFFPQQLVALEGSVPAWVSVPERVGLATALAEACWLRLHTFQLQYPVVEVCSVHGFDCSAPPVFTCCPLLACGVPLSLLGSCFATTVLALGLVSVWTTDAWLTCETKQWRCGGPRKM